MSNEVEVKLKLVSVAKTNDDKNNYVEIQSIGRTNEEEIYVFPDATRKLTDHPLLLARPSIKQIADKVVKKRNTYRTLRVTLKDKLLEAYTDDDGNLSFEGILLDPAEKVFTRDDVPNDNETPKVEIRKRSLRQIEKEICIEKFNGKNYNAATWIELFRDECERIEVEDEQLTDALGICLDGYPVDWYIAAKKTIRDGPWQQWKKDFLQTFGSNGWSGVVNAIRYRYFKGSLVEYALKKHNLLLDSDPDLTEKSRVSLIVIGLPIGTQNRISRKEIVTIGKLMEKLNELEFRKEDTGKPWERRKSYGGFERDKGFKSDKRTYQPCTHCKKKGKDGMMHPEEACVNNPRGVNFGKPREEWKRVGPVKIANNTQFERQLNDEDYVKN